MLKRIIASAVMATATQATRASKSQPPRMEEVAGGEARVLIPQTPRPCSLPLPVLSQRYSTGLPSLKRYDKRYEGEDARRTSENSPSRTFVNKPLRIGLVAGTLTRRRRRQPSEYVCPFEAGYQDHRQGHGQHAHSEGRNYDHRHSLHSH